MGHLLQVFPTITKNVVRTNYKIKYMNLMVNDWRWYDKERSVDFFIALWIQTKGLRSVIWVEKPVCCCNACTAIYPKKKQKKKTCISTYEEKKKT